MLFGLLSLYLHRIMKFNYLREKNKKWGPRCPQGCYFTESIISRDLQEHHGNCYGHPTDQILVIIFIGTDLRIRGVNCFSSFI